MSESGQSKSVQTVAQIISERMQDLGLSTRELDALTEKRGSRVAYSTIARIANGKYKPTHAQIESLAEALQLPAKRLLSAAGIEEVGAPFVLPEYARHLTLEEREAVTHLVRVMAESKNRSHHGSQDRDQEQPGNVHELREREDPQPEQKTGLAALERGLGEGIDPDATLEDT